MFRPGVAIADDEQRMRYLNESESDLKVEGAFANSAAKKNP